MTQWTDRVRSHAVWQLMEELGPALDQAVGREGIDPITIEGIERIRSILAFTGKRLAGVEPQLVQQGPLDGIAGAVRSVLSDITSYISDGDAAHVVNANTNADPVLAHVAALNYPFVADDWMALRDAAVGYRSTLEHNIEWVHSSFSTITAQASTLEDRLADLAAAIDSEGAKLTAVGIELSVKVLGFGRT